MRTLGMVLGGRPGGWRARLAAVLAVLVVAVVLAGRLADLGAGSGDQAPLAGGRSGSVATRPALPPTTPAPGSTVQSSIGPGSTTAGADAGADGPTGPEASPYGRPAAPGATATAVAFVRAWLTPPAGTPADTWWRGVARLADPQLAGQLRLTDPERVPATRITGLPRSRHGGPTSAEVVVPTDAGEVLVLCTAVRGRWLVSDFDLDRAAR